MFGYGLLGEFNPFFFDPPQPPVPAPMPPQVPEPMARDPQQLWQPDFDNAKIPMLPNSDSRQGMVPVPPSRPQIAPAPTTTGSLPANAPLSILPPAATQPQPTPPATARGQIGYSPDPVATDLPPHARAFLNTIAGPESGGKYNVRYTPRGGATFDDLSRHPGIFERGPHGPSSAAGRYQFTKTTWNRLGGGDFSPENQDRRAWQLAQQDYKARTGQDLNTVLQNGGLNASILRTLTPTWQGFKAPAERLIATYNHSLGRFRDPNYTPSGAPYMGTAPGASGSTGGAPTHRQAEIASMEALQRFEAEGSPGVPTTIDKLGNRLKNIPAHRWVNAINGLMKGMGGMMGGYAGHDVKLQPVQGQVHKPEGKPYGLLAPTWSPTQDRRKKGPQGLL